MLFLNRLNLIVADILYFKIYETNTNTEFFIEFSEGIEKKIKKNEKYFNLLGQNKISFYLENKYICLQKEIINNK